MAVWPHNRKEDDGLDAIGVERTEAVSDHRRAHPPAPRNLLAPASEAPSVIVDPAAQKPERTLPGTRRRRQEPTLVIRDRRQVDRLRASIAEQQRANNRRRVRTALVWMGAGASALIVGAAAGFFIGGGAPQVTEVVSDSDGVLASSPSEPSAKVKGESKPRAPAKKKPEAASVSTKTTSQRHGASLAIDSTSAPAAESGDKTAAFESGKTPSRRVSLEDLGKDSVSIDDLPSE